MYREGNKVEARVTSRYADGFNPLGVCFGSLNSRNRGAKARKPGLQGDCSNVLPEIINTPVGNSRTNDAVI